MKRYQYSLLALPLLGIAALVWLEEKPATKLQVSTTRAASRHANSANNARVAAEAERPRPQQARTGPSASLEVRAMRNELEQVEQELASLRASKEASRSPEQALTPEEAAEKEESYNIGMALDFEQESRDASWANQASDELAPLLKSLASDTSMATEPDCRSTMCRVEFEHASADGHQALGTRVFEGASWSGAAHFHPLERDGRHLTVAYFLKPGHSLPELL